MGMKAGMWCHVEIPVKDRKKAQKFYGKVFGWKFREMPEMDYTLYCPQEGAEVGGGLWNPPSGIPRQIVNYILVKKIEPMVAKVKKSGGKLLYPKTEVHGAGWFAQVSDPDGKDVFFLGTKTPRSSRFPRKGAFHFITRHRWKHGIDTAARAP